MLEIAVNCHNPKTANAMHYTTGSSVQFSSGAYNNVTIFTTQERADAVAAAFNGALVIDMADETVARNAIRLAAITLGMVVHEAVPAVPGAPMRAQPFTLDPVTAQEMRG